MEVFDYYCEFKWENELEWQPVVVHGKRQVFVPFIAHIEMDKLYLHCRVGILLNSYVSLLPGLKICHGLCYKI